MKKINPSRVFGVMLALLVMIWSFGSVSGYALADEAKCEVTSQWYQLSTAGCVLSSDATNATLLIDLRNADETSKRDVIVSRINQESRAGNCDTIIGTVSVPAGNVIKEVDECKPSNASFKMAAANRGYISYRLSQRVDLKGR
ncbi:MAG: hypothetical protein JGK12_00470 [Microcoleus sp. PH2017_01_SCD_O_A]|uniref:hypothetical protein n=1 Tax=unclassified Microcoleus TaxID=2642155 RepID=UPI001E0FCA86|nr:MULTISPECIES: hypothetical protein [unclassified Microcoleus]MCC3416863.1 hypothetical protein [Microcoleus sp. PH2017_07_MST_O_A]MCC3422422.1 hypothetical protein [Microcoleus sp. PH2017_01_SCD_O_A]MCC3497136.1 hypothetical protein [Microcoleus sp. PH2017_15_JOR_U_A]MCC3512341.1 hypothetical protein [Microcoleus sp. PH2017_17_BER_D_A]